MNLKKLLIPVAVILACAVVLFAANAAFAGTAESNRQEEFDTIAKLGADNGMVFLWLNAYVDDVSEWDSASWKSGGAVGYTNWYSGEPSGGDEYYLAMFSVNGTWYNNDTANSVSEYSGKKGYVLQIDE